MGLLSAIYGSGVSCKRLLYTKYRKPRRLPVKTVCIGNITTGGTGKTPAVISLAKEAIKQGFRPCILTRGYKGKEKSVCFVTKGAGPLLEPVSSGDEPYLMASLLENVPVVMGKVRYEAGMFALEELPDKPDLFILDDGFQHWALQRDIDVVLIDATNPFGNGRLLPEGILREKLTSLKRAGHIILTKSNICSDEHISRTIDKIKEHNSDAPLFTSLHRPVSLTNKSGESNSIETLKGKKVFVFSAIANPSYFQATLRSAGADIIEFRKFRDHYFYTQHDMDEIKSAAMGMDIITTEKDIVKLRALDISGNIYALRIDFEIDAEFYNNLFGRLG